MKILGLVNARGGSKGVPRKNIRPLAGKPLIAYAIEAALASRSITDVILSTEDEQIAEVARSHGAETPFVRPNDLATDTALQIDVIIHAIRTLREMGREYDAITVLQPTAPLRQADDIDGALSLIIEEAADSVASFSPVTSQHPYYMYRIDDGRPQPFVSAPDSLQRQDFPEAYVRNGAIYASRTRLIEEKRNFYGGAFRAYVMPPERSVNIDTPLDWDIAEILFKKRKPS